MKSLVSSIIILLIFLFAGYAKSEEENKSLKEGARHCIQCHGQKFYSFTNSWTDELERKRMNPYLMIDSTAYSQGVHGTFSCDDCHSPDYENYPHDMELKLEPKYTCLDCHGGDEAYAHLHFDEIEQEVEKSVHAKAFDGSFKCEMCHNPHSNKLIATSKNYNIREIVQQNNATCLYCHDDPDNFNMYSENDPSEIAQIHNWLPNQSLHFKSVRCIECHTAVEDTFMVAHRILAKEKALKNCAQCHSQNNILTAKLYKYQMHEARQEDGLYAASVFNESYVIGAHRNRFLNILGIAGLFLTILGISAHIVLRLINKK